MLKEKVEYYDLKPADILIEKKAETYVVDFADIRPAREFSEVESTKKIEIASMDKKKEIEKKYILRLGQLTLFCLENRKYQKTEESNNFKLNTEIAHHVYEKIPVGFFFMLKSMLSLNLSTQPTFPDVQKAIPEFSKVNFKYKYCASKYKKY